MHRIKAASWPHSSPTSALRSTDLMSDTVVILATFLGPVSSAIAQFSRKIVRHARCPIAGPSACGLRQGAVNAGGSQVGYQDEGAFGRPIRFTHPPRQVVLTPVIATRPRLRDIPAPV